MAVHQTDQNSLSNYAVSNTHVFYFVPGTTAEAKFTDRDKTDVVESTLLCQLTASSAALSVDQADEWLNKYTDIAGVAAWLLQSGSSFKIANKELLSISLDITAINILRDKETAIENMGILEALLYLKGKNPGLEILEENGKKDSAGTFQLTVCKKSSSGDITMQLWPFVFETTETVISNIFQPINDAGTYTLKYMADPTIFVLNLNQYSKVRDEISGKLSGYTDDLVKYLSL